jgi:hypothetical protein
VIYALEENIKEIVQLIVSYFPQKKGLFKDVMMGLFGSANATGCSLDLNTSPRLQRNRSQKIRGGRSERFDPHREMDLVELWELKRVC